MRYWHAIVCLDHMMLRQTVPFIVKLWRKQGSKTVCIMILKVALWQQWEHFTNDSCAISIHSYIEFTKGCDIWAYNGLIPDQKNIYSHSHCSIYINISIRIFFCSSCFKPYLNIMVVYFSVLWLRNSTGNALKCTETLMCNLSVLYDITEN